MASALCMASATLLLAIAASGRAHDTRPLPPVAVDRSFSAVWGRQRLALMGCLLEPWACADAVWNAATQGLLGGVPPWHASNKRQGAPRQPQPQQQQHQTQHQTQQQQQQQQQQQRRGSVPPGFVAVQAKRETATTPQRQPPAAIGGGVIVECIASGDECLRPEPAASG